MAIFWPTPGFKGKTFVSSGFSTEGTLMSAAKLPHCSEEGKKQALNISNIQWKQACLRHHMFTKFCMRESSACHGGTSPMTVEHFLQDCQNHQNLRAETWPANTSVREKIYSPVENLQRMVACVRATRVPVWANITRGKKTRRKKKKQVC